MLKIISFWKILRLSPLQLSDSKLDLKKKRLLKLFMCVMGIVATCVSVHNGCVVPVEAGRGSRIIDGCKPLCRCWEVGPLEEQARVHIEIVFLSPPFLSNYLGVAIFLITVNVSQTPSWSSDFPSFLPLPYYWSCNSCDFSGLWLSCRIPLT